MPSTWTLPVPYWNGNDIAFHAVPFPASEHLTKIHFYRSIKPSDLSAIHTIIRSVTSPPNLTAAATQLSKSIQHTTALLKVNTSEFWTAFQPRTTKELTAEITTLRKTNSENAELMRQLVKITLSNTETIAQQQNMIQDLFADLIATKEQLLQAKDREIEAKDKEIKAKEKAMIAKDAEIARLQAEMERRKREVEVSKK